MSAQSSASELVGAVLNGRWRLVRLLGEGGMGAVFEADGAPGVGKRAIKLLHQEYVREEQILARFFAEAQATRTLNHPNVAQVLETGTAENGTPYLVMELLQGVPVSSYVDQGQALPPPQAVHIVHGVLQALAAAHARNVIHRDIKPDNLFLVHDANGSFHAKVLDFGIAKVMDVAGGMGHKTRTGVLLGTPGYMSPEQIKNSKDVDARADLWSVGIIFYELLAGTSPFPAGNDFARLTSVLTEEMTPIEQVAPHLVSWSGFFHRALAKDPARRFQSADEMASALLAAARGPALRPPPTLQGPQGQRAPLPYGPAGNATPALSSDHATTVMPVMGDRPSGSGPPPSSMFYPVSMPQPSSLLASSPMSTQQSSMMPSPASAQHVAAVSQGSIPPPPRSGTIASTPPPEWSSQVGPNAVNVGPTHVSARPPQGAPVPRDHVPSIEVIDASYRGSGVSWVVVGVIAVVALGLGFALGILVG